MKKSSKSKKIKVAQVARKRADGRLEKTAIAYADVTAEASELFDGVKKAILVTDEFYGSKDEYGEWARTRRSETIAVDGKRMELGDGFELQVKFSSGKAVRIGPSVWSSVSSISGLSTEEKAI